MTEKKKTLKPATTKKREDDILRNDLDKIDISDIEDVSYDDLEDDIAIEDDVIIEDDDNNNSKIVECLKEEQIDKKDKEQSEKEIEKLIKETQKMQPTSEEYIEKRLSNEDEAKDFLKNFKKFLSSKDFDRKCEELSVLKKVDKKRVAESFSQKALATIADCLGVVIEVTYDATIFLINFLSKILKAACGIICSVANRLLGFLTLGYTKTLV